MTALQELRRRPGARRRRRRRAGRHASSDERLRPPSPATSICLNFGLRARRRRLAATCASTTLTNPEKEQQEFVDSIQASVKWLGFDWGTNLLLRERPFRAATTSRGRHDRARRGLRSTAARSIQIRRRAAISTASASTVRSARVDARQNLDLSPLRAQRGRVPADGAHVLRARGRHGRRGRQDAGPRALSRPLARAHRAGDAWCIDPDVRLRHMARKATSSKGSRTRFARTRVRQSPASSTTSCLDRAVGAEARRAATQQIEFAKLQLTYTMLSERKLQEPRREEASSTLETIRACRRSRACGGAARHARGPARVLRSRRRLHARQHRRRDPPRARLARGPQRAIAPRDGRGCARSRSSSRISPKAR